jgi:putative transposase
MDAAGRWQILRLHVEDQIPLAALARDTGVGLRTLERWHARYRTEGYTGLGTRRRADAGSHHLPSELVSLIEGLALSKPRPTIITIHRKISAICERGWPVPSYGVVRAIIADLDRAWSPALEGPASIGDKYELALGTAGRAPNAMWQADHTMLDIPW